MGVGATRNCHVKAGLDTAYRGGLTSLTNPLPERLPLSSG